MHFLEAYLVANTAPLYLAALALYGLNLFLYTRADRRRRTVTALSVTPAFSLRARLSSTLLGTLLFLLPGLFFTGEVRALFVGGFLVLQLASLATTVSSLQITRALLAPGALGGQLAVPRATQTRLAAASLFSFALFSLGACALTGSPSFFSGAFFLATTAIGYRRRANQYERQDRAGGSAAPPAPPAPPSPLEPPLPA